MLINITEAMAVVDGTANNTMLAMTREE